MYIRLLKILVLPCNNCLYAIATVVNPWKFHSEFFVPTTSSSWTVIWYSLLMTADLFQALPVFFYNFKIYEAENETFFKSHTIYYKRQIASKVLASFFLCMFQE